MKIFYIIPFINLLIAQDTTFNCNGWSQIIFDQYIVENNIWGQGDINDFTQFDTSPFYNDRPVVFLETNDGGVKTISAPHMIATLLYNLELFEEQNVVVYGAKGRIYLRTYCPHSWSRRTRYSNRSFE